MRKNGDLKKYLYERFKQCLRRTIQLFALHEVDPSYFNQTTMNGLRTLADSLFDFYYYDQEINQDMKDHCYEQLRLKDTTDDTQFQSSDNTTLSINVLLARVK